MLFGNVAGDFRGPDNVASRTNDWRDRQRNVDKLAVFPHAHGFKMVDTLAGAESRQNRRLFVEMVLRNDDRDGEADNFLRGVTKDTFGALVPTRDDTVQRFTNDRIICRLDER